MKWIKKNVFWMLLIATPFALYLSIQYGRIDSERKRTEEKKQADSIINVERARTIKFHNELLAVRDTLNNTVKELNTSKLLLKKYQTEKNKVHVKHVQIYNHNDSVITARLKRALSGVKESKRRQPKLQ